MGQRPSRKRSPYIRIMVAAESGHGVQLSHDDVREMSLDTAVVDAAINDACSSGRCPECWKRRCTCGWIELPEGPTRRPPDHHMTTARRREEESDD